MKIYQCLKCRSVFKNESDMDAHISTDAADHQVREYELEEFLTRFLVAA